VQTESAVYTGCGQLAGIKTKTDYATRLNYGGNYTLWDRQL